MDPPIEGAKPTTTLIGIEWCNFNSKSKADKRIPIETCDFG